MSEPIVFISRSRVKPGRLDDLRALTREGGKRLEAEKPRTLAFLPYIGADGDVTIVHVFADAEAFDLHVEGAAERSRGAYELIDPISFEIYGRPSRATLDDFHKAAAGGLGLTVSPELAGGFLRSPR